MENRNPVSLCPKGNMSLSVLAHYLHSINFYQQCLHGVDQMLGTIANNDTAALGSNMQGQQKRSLTFWDQQGPLGPLRPLLLFLEQGYCVNTCGMGNDCAARGDMQCMSLEGVTVAHA